MTDFDSTGASGTRPTPSRLGTIPMRALTS